MRKTHPFLTLWESHRFKSDGNRFSFVRVLPRRRRSPLLAGGFGSVAWSIPLGLMCGRPGPPFSRAISSRCAATVRRSSATSSSSCNTKLLSSAAERASMSVRDDIPRLSQKSADSGTARHHTESFRRTHIQTPKPALARTFAPLTQIADKSLNLLARPERFELPTPRFVVWCSIPAPR